MNNTSIVICGQKYNIGTRVILWDEPNGLNGYDTTTYFQENRKTGKKEVIVSGKRYSKRTWKYSNPNLHQLQKIVSQFFLHHSGLYHSQTTYDVLHKQRGLSVHFILDDNGVLYQTLDVKEKAWHGGKSNPISIGIEIDSRASADRFPDAYDKIHQKKYDVGPRLLKQDNVQKMIINGYDYNNAQYETLIRLGIKLIEIFPKISQNPDFPRKNGEIIKHILKYPQQHNGFICHYHASATKWDPGSFDYNRFLNGVKKKDPFALRSYSFNKHEEQQYILNLLGYDAGIVDGIYGPKTKSAMKHFQTDYNLVCDGVWGENTNIVINKVLKERGI